MMIGAWKIRRSVYNTIVATNEDGRHLVGQTLDEIIIKIDQIDHPEKVMQ